MSGSLIFFVLIFLLCAFQSEAFAFFCGNQLVSEGDRASEATLKCGQPLSRESHSEFIIEGKGTDSERRIEIIVEEWTYNFGPDSWLTCSVLKTACSQKTRHEDTEAEDIVLSSRPAASMNFTGLP